MSSFIARNQNMAGLISSFIILVGILIAAHYLAKYGCINRYKTTDIEYRWNGQLNGGCQLKINGKWIPESKYRETDK